MKKIILIASIFYASICRSQSVDTSIHSISASPIKPAKVSITDTGFARWIGVKVGQDDLNNRVQIYWNLLNRIPNKNKNNDNDSRDFIDHIILDGNEILINQDYDKYKDDDMYLYRYIAQKFGLIIK